MNIAGLGAIKQNVGENAARNIIKQNRMAGDSLARHMLNLKSAKEVTEHEARAKEYAGKVGGEAAAWSGINNLINTGINLGGAYLGSQIGSGNLFSGRGSRGTDSFGRDFDDPWATTNATGLIVDPFGTDTTIGGTTTEWNTDMDINSGGGLFGNRGLNSWF